MSDYIRVNGTAARIDFSATESTSPLIIEDRLQAGPVTLARCQARANPDGGSIVSPQTTVVVPIGPAFDLDWQSPDGDRVQSTMIGRGRVMLYEADAPVWKRRHAAPSIFILAMAPEFLDDVRRRGFEPSNGSSLNTAVGFEDPVADDLVRLAERELREGGMRGRLYVDSLATALATHVLQTRGGDKQAARHIGGLPPLHLRRVTEYVAAHLSDELTLADLAAIAGLRADPGSC